MVMDNSSVQKEISQETPLRVLLEKDVEKEAELIAQAKKVPEAQVPKKMIRM